MIIFCQNCFDNFLKKSIYVILMDCILIVFYMFFNTCYSPYIQYDLRFGPQRNSRMFEFYIHTNYLDYLFYFPFYYFSIVYGFRSIFIYFLSFYDWTLSYFSYIRHFLKKRPHKLLTFCKVKLSAWILSSLSIYFFLVGLCTSI